MTVDLGEELAEDTTKQISTREVSGEDPLDAGFVEVKIENFDVNCEIADEAGAEPQLTEDL